jgi:hypothetical protein
LTSWGIRFWYNIVWYTVNNHSVPWQLARSALDAPLPPPPSLQW